MEPLDHRFIDVVGKFFQSFRSSAPLTCSIDPAVYIPEGRSFIGQSVSLAKFMKEQMAGDKDIIDGPLTDNDYSDSDTDIKASNGKGDEEATGHSSRGEPKTRGQKRKQRQYEGRKNVRARKQVEKGTDIKAVCDRYGLMACRNPIELEEYDAYLNSSVTLPAWTGSRIINLPKQLFMRNQLEVIYGMRYFEWDGRYVHFFYLIPSSLLTIA